MPVLVKRLTPANFEAILHERPYALVRVDRDRKAFHEGLVEFFSRAHPARFAFGTVQRSELSRPAWLDETFVSAVGRVRGGVQDGYYLFERGLVVGHHRGEVRAGVHYGDPEELAAQRQRVHEVAFAGRRVPEPTLEAARAIIVYFDEIVARKERGTDDAGEGRYVREERERVGAPASRAPALANPYEVLGLTPRATDEELKAAYREGLKMNHPDKVAHLSAALQKFAEAQTLAIVDAYERIKKERGG